MIYGSVCSGIEAATVAWHGLGWRPAWFAEIDPFASAVLAHRYPDVPNYGDFTKIESAGPIELLVAGTPCQSFSVAGHRLGLDDPRGNLTLEYLRLAARVRPRWLVWENVPGVLSIDGGRTFGAILGALGKLGYGFAYRVLDAQYCGVPQRRRRVFVVGYLGAWQAAAAVLFERESLRRDLAARRTAGAGVAALTAHSLGGCGGDVKQAQAGHLIAFGGNNTTGPINIATACNAHGMRMDFETETFICGTLNANGKVAVRRLTPRECERLQGFPDDYTLIPNYRRKLRADEAEEIAAYLGIPLDEARQLGATPDGPRYKAIGNSMAVPVMKWIGHRIDTVDRILREAG